MHEWLAILSRTVILTFKTIVCGRNNMKSIKIKGMSCQHCVMAVTKALTAIDGLKDVHVDLQKATATYDETKPVNAVVVEAAVKKAGFEVVG